LPPYHPDYQDNEDDDGFVESDDSEDDYDQEQANSPRVRRGSEGYEVKSMDREQLLERYLRELGEQPGRYHRYIPQVYSDDDAEEEGEEEDNVPLGQKVASRQNTTVTTGR
jgi:palmitoyltransferase ZDHHC6